MDEFQDLPLHDGEPQIEEESMMEINSTNDFRTAVEAGSFEAAEEWLVAQKDQIDQGVGNYDARWADHREGELFKKYRKLRLWKKALLIAQNSYIEDNRQNRIQALLGDAGMTLEAIEALQ